MASNNNEEVEKPFACRRANCDKRYTQLSNRSRHENECDKGEIVKPPANFQCENPWCDKMFKSSKMSNYTRHLNTCNIMNRRNNVNNMEIKDIDLLVYSRKVLKDKLTQHILSTYVE